MTKKRVIIICAAGLIVFTVFIGLNYLLSDSQAYLYDFISNFDKAQKENFDFGDIIDSYLPKQEPSVSDEDFESLLSAYKTDNTKIIHNGVNRNNYSGFYRDGYLELLFYQVGQEKNEYRVKFRMTDDRNYYEVKLITGIYAKVTISRYMDGKCEILSEPSYFMAQGEFNGLEIVFINNFLSVAFDKDTLYQGLGPNIQANAGKISFYTDHSDNRMNAYFIPLSGNLRARLDLVTKSDNANLFKQNIFREEPREWNTLESEDDLYIQGKTNKFLKRTRLNDETFPAIYFMPSGQLRYDIDVPDNAYLDFNLSAVETYIHDPKRLVFSVSIQATGDAESAETYDYNFGDIADYQKKFTPVRINLSQFKGKSCRIAFSFNTVDGVIQKQENNVVMALGAPILYSQRGEKDVNVILISIDTLAAGHVGCYGYERDTTPNIDAFAGDSTQFQNTISSAPYTLPSHMSIFTSLYPNETGYIQHVNSKDQLAVSRIALNVKTLAEYMHEAGYHTAAITGGGMILSIFGFDKGFSYYYDRFRAVHDARELGDMAIDWLDKNGDKKFYLFLHTYEVHKPYLRDYYIKTLPDNRKTLRDVSIAAYDSGIRYADHQIGRILEYLKEKGLYENTLIIITSDHGENFRTVSKYSQGKTYGFHGETLYDCEVKVPLLIGGLPEFSTGDVVKEQVALVDIMPTILDSLSIKYSTGIRGVSLVPYIQGKETRNRIAYSEAVLFETYQGYDPRAIRDNSFKYIYNRPIENYWSERSAMQPDELYSLTDDPDESNNIVEKKLDIRSKYRNTITRILDSITRNERNLKRQNSTGLKDRKDLEQHLRGLGYIQ